MMIVAGSARLCVAFIVLQTAFAFVPIGPPTRHQPLVVAKSEMGSYEAMLAKARAKKAGQGAVGAPAPVPSPLPIPRAAAIPPPPPPPPQQPQASVRPTPTQEVQQVRPTVPMVASPPDDATPSPISESVQEEIRVVLALLNDRLRTGSPLPPEKLARFDRAIAAVLHDVRSPPSEVVDVSAHAVTASSQTALALAPATKLTQDVRAKLHSQLTQEWREEGESTEERSEGENELHLPDEFEMPEHMIGHAGSRSYYVEGMENMTSEEYREALSNKIVKTIEERRNKGGPVGPQSSESYMSNLNARKRPPPTSAQ